MKYKDKEIPDGKADENLHYSERRAILYGMIASKGHPDEVNRTKQAQRFDVNPSTITRDIQAIRDEVVEELGANAEFLIDTVFRKALHEKSKDEAWMEAVDVAERWSKWLFGRDAVAPKPRGGGSSGGSTSGSDGDTTPSEATAQQNYMDMLEAAHDAGEMGDPSDAFLDPAELVEPNVSNVEADDDSESPDAETTAPASNVE